MPSLRLKGDLVMSNVYELAHEVNLNDANVGSHMTLRGSIFAGGLCMAHLKVAGDLFMDGNAQFAEVLLTNAKIGSNLWMQGSVFQQPTEALPA